MSGGIDPALGVGHALECGRIGGARAAAPGTGFARAHEHMAHYRPGVDGPPAFEAEPLRRWPAALRRAAG